MLLVGSIAASFVDRLGAPTLLVFLGLGMLLVASGRLRDVQLALDLVEVPDDAPHSGVNAPFSG